MSFYSAGFEKPIPAFGRDKFAPSCNNNSFFALEPFGLRSDMAPPLPIPNREVKHVSAHDTRSQSAVGKIGKAGGLKSKKKEFYPNF